MKLTRMLLAWLCFLAVCAPLAQGAAARSDAVVQGVDTERYPVIGVDVILPSAMTESGNRPAFSVRENGKRVEVLDARGEQTKQAVDAVLLLDVSGSMKGAAIQAAKDAAVSFIGELDEPSRVSVIAFSDKASAIVPASATASQAKAGIDRLSAGGETALYDALLLATKSVNVSEDTAPVIVVLSDGGDTVSRTRVEAVVSELRRIDVPVVAVALNSPEADFRTLGLLAAQTGGRMATVADSAQLAKTYQGIAREFQTRYRVNYRTRRPSTAEIEIEVTAVGETGKAVAETVIRNPEANLQSVSTAPLEPIPPASLMTLTGAVFAMFASVVMLVFAVGAIAARPGTTIDQLRFYEQAEASASIGADTGRTSDKVSTAVVGAVDFVAGKRGLTRLVAERLERAGLPLRAAEYMTIHIVFVVVVGIVAQLILGRFALSVLLVVLATAVPMTWIQYRIDKRKKRFEEQLPDVLNLLSGSLRAGWGLQQSIDVVVNQASPPVSEEFLRVQTEVRLGRSVSEALESVAARVESVDFDWIVSAIVIQRETGGNLAELLDVVAGTIRERAALRRHIGALTAEGRLSAIILIGLPFVEAALLFTINPVYMSALYTTVPGLIISVIGIVMLVVGSLWLRKATKVEV